MAFLAPRRQQTVSEIAGGTGLGTALEGIPKVADRYSERFRQGRQEERAMAGEERAVAGEERAVAGEERKVTDWERLQEKTKDKKKSKDAVLYALENAPEMKPLMELDPLKTYGIEGLRSLEFDEIMEKVADAKLAEAKALEESTKRKSRASFVDKTIASRGATAEERLGEGFTGLEQGQKERIGGPEVSMAGRFAGPTAQ